MFIVNTRNDVAKIVTHTHKHTHKYTQGQLDHDEAVRLMWSCPEVRCLRCVLCPVCLLGENIRVTQDSSHEATEDFREQTDRHFLWETTS